MNIVKVSKNLQNTKHKSYMFLNKELIIIHDEKFINNKSGVTQRYFKYEGNTYQVTIAHSSLPRTADISAGYQTYQDISFTYQHKFLASGSMTGAFFKSEYKSVRNDEALMCRLIGRVFKPLLNPTIDFKANVFVEVVHCTDHEINHFSPCCFAMGILLYELNLITEIPIAFSYSRKENSRSELELNKAFKEDVEFVQYYVAYSKDSLISISGQSGSDESIYSYKSLRDDVEFIYANYAKNMYLILERDPNIKKIKEKNDKLMEEGLERNRDDYKKVEEALKDIVHDFVTNFKYEFEPSAKFELLSLCQSVNAELELRSSLVESYIYDVINEWTNFRRIYERKRIRKATDIRPINLLINDCDNNRINLMFRRGNTKLYFNLSIIKSAFAVQIVNTPLVNTRHNFILQYVFNGFVCGYTMQSDNRPSRRELGHGEFVKKAISRSVSVADAISAVSMITQSDGSSSLATAIAGGFALWKLGLTQEKIAGVALGCNVYYKDGKRISNYIVDLTEFEDHKSKMDFKLIGTEDAVYGIQMDSHDDTVIRMDEWNRVVFLSQLSIRKINNGIYSGQKQNETQNRWISEVVAVPSDLIGLIIGKKGASLNGLIEKHGVYIDIEKEAKKTETRIFVKGNKENVRNCIDEIKGKIFKPIKGDIIEVKCYKIIFGNKIEYKLNNNLYRYESAYKIGVEPHQSYKVRVIDVRESVISVEHI